MPETVNDVIRRYLQDAIAAETAFEKQLRVFATDTDHIEVKTMFEQHAEETRVQHERLTARLEALGGAPSGWKGFMSSVFGLGPKTAQLGHDESEKRVQDLMMAYAVENSEVAMYESMIAACEAAGDTETAALAREIQAEERRTAEKVWNQIHNQAAEAFYTVTGSQRPNRQAA